MLHPLHTTFGVFVVIHLSQWFSKSLSPPTSDIISCSLLKSKILTLIQFFSLNHKTKWFKTKTRLSSAEVTKSEGFFSPLSSEVFLGNATDKYRNDVFTTLRPDLKHISVTVIYTKEHMRNIQDFIKNVHVRCCLKHISVYQQN